MKIIVPALVLCCGIAAHAQAPSPTFAERGNCILKVSAYLDSSRLPETKYNPIGRFDMNLFQFSGALYQWDFTLPDAPDEHYTNISGAFGSPDWKTQKKATIRATLHQFDTCEEEVTFRDLDLAPLQSPIAGITPRALSLSKEQSLTTPSGITITLPAQSYDAIPNNMNGNPNALFVRVEVTPNTKSISPLPNSPLWRKHHCPITLQLGATAANKEWVYYVSASPSYGYLAVSIPNLKTETHLDQLTFYVRQRVDLHADPIHIDVPIFKPTPVKVARTP